MLFKKLTPFGLLVLLGACTAVPKVAAPERTAPPTVRPATPATNPAPPSHGFIPPTVLRERGLEAVIGRDAGQVQRLLGEPRLRTPEGDALKLQYTGEACVLDVYLYPLRPGAEPVATHVEARRPSDAEGVDRASCLAALRR